MNLVAGVIFKLSLRVQNLNVCGLCCRSIALFLKSLVSVLPTVFFFSCLDHEICEGYLLTYDLVSLKA